MEIKDHYSTLGLSPSASLAEVKRSYRRLAKLLHPDSPGPGTDRRLGRFLELQEAYETLSDPVRRARYDAFCAAAGTQTTVAAEQDTGFWARPRGPAAPVDDIFDQLERFGPLHSDWGGGGFRVPAGTRGVPQEGRCAPDPRATGGNAPLVVELTLEEALRGAERLLGGRRVRIPPGARNRMRLRVPEVPGAGDGPPGCPRDGPRLIEITLRPHPRYTVEGDDLRTELAVPAMVFRRGGRVTLETPGGRLVVALPPGLGPGKLVRLRGRGLPATPLRRAGDILIRLALAGRTREEEIH